MRGDAAAIAATDQVDDILDVGRQMKTGGEQVRRAARHHGQARRRVDDRLGRSADAAAVMMRIEAGGYLR